MSSEPVKVGFIGCGVIAESYIKNALGSKIAPVKAAADLRPEAAGLFERTYGITAVTIEDLLADPDIEIVLNLTPPQAHAEITRKIVQAGKHVYSEKPLGVTFEEGKELVRLANENGVRISCAPDTFLGAAHQAVRRLVDSEELGKVSGGAVSWLTRGSAEFHAKPSFFIFKRGGGPHLDMGPYYVTQLVNLLGPVKRVTAIASNPFPNREVLRGPLKGSQVQITEVPTTVNGALLFENDANVSVTVSWDVRYHTRVPFELYLENGTILGADPNFFGGEVFKVGADRQKKRVDIGEFPFAETNKTFPNGLPIADYRYAGVLDLASAIRNKRPHRANGQLALHVLEVLKGLELSSETGTHIDMSTTCGRPNAMPLGKGEDALLSDFAQ